MRPMSRLVFFSLLFGHLANVIWTLSDVKHEQNATNSPILSEKGDTPSTLVVQTSVTFTSSLLQASGPAIIQEVSDLSSQAADLSGKGDTPSTLVEQTSVTFTSSLLQASDPAIIQEVSDLSGQAADFIKTLEHSQLVAFLQIMLLQNRHSSPTVALSDTVATSREGRSTTEIDPHSHTEEDIFLNATKPKSPLAQMFTMFQSSPGQGVLKAADNIGKSQLGRYVSAIHEYWKKASLSARDHYRNTLLSNIDSLNVPLGLQHAIQELLPGLVTGNPT